MRLQPRLVLEYNHGDSMPFLIKVVGNDESGGTYLFVRLEEALEGFKIAWNIFEQTLMFFEELKSDRKV